jgi:hypothetical protein
MAIVGAPLHTVWPATVATVGVGFTVIVKLSAVPAHPFADGTTLITPSIAVTPLLVPVNDAMFPLPAAARPMLASLLVQAYVVPLTVPVKATALVDAPLHTVWLATEVTVGVGFTVIVNVCEPPIQVLAEGTTEIIPSVAIVPALVAVNEGILPLPDMPRPIVGLVFVQE